jgi:hypothetical protein
VATKRRANFLFRQLNADKYQRALCGVSSPEAISLAL